QGSRTAARSARASPKVLISPDGATRDCPGGGGSPPASGHPQRLAAIRLPGTPRRCGTRCITSGPCRLSLPRSLCSRCCSLLPSRCCHRIGFVQRETIFKLTLAPSSGPRLQDGCHEPL